ncbi:uncharacterized protein MONOS_11615 [Monocercomonoides exilis]|uniref:uncharacterized protein n=1 Tax=Monocercomonoides exilis TaxID=2049356 RepID=UPI00355A2152|nr:hypothetical protein MONOS_11615 [Monocercomonoides exilis]|eukprot:MONOS_11615.1-p1 / transcript=MONOS_11615.1 / gene=MONOS_11615 / organism=Monocercomonoides_exilis_PA203 / gene_product=unspecified product / transcript_product=unspecified product / location=Mono_scaffold00593:884-2395(-) / protein_length=504 / sequence_SO=supercontig / SO=protein_coding / is_pseudo=false
MKGGDEALPNASLWILNEGCELAGIASSRSSAFFIPSLEMVERTEKEGNEGKTELKFRGALLLPCNLSFQMMTTVDDTLTIEKYDFEDNGFISESEIHGMILATIFSSTSDDAEISVSILFGDIESPSTTNAIVVKNKTIQKDEQNVDVTEMKSDVKEKAEWSLIGFIVCLIVLVMVVCGTVVLGVILWKKQKAAKKIKERIEIGMIENTEKMEMTTENEESKFLGRENCTEFEKGRLNSSVHLIDEEKLGKNEVEKIMIENDLEEEDFIMNSGKNLIEICTIKEAFITEEDEVKEVDKMEQNFELNDIKEINTEKKTRKKVKKSKRKKGAKGSKLNNLESESKDEAKTEGGIGLRENAEVLLVSFDQLDENEANIERLQECSRLLTSSSLSSNSSSSNEHFSKSVKSEEVHDNLRLDESNRLNESTNDDNSFTKSCEKNDSAENEADEEIIGKVLHCDETVYEKEEQTKKKRKKKKKKGKEIIVNETKNDEREFDEVIQCVF